MKIWNVKKSKCVFSKFMGLGLKSETETGSQTITQAWFTESEQNLTVVVADHTISMYTIENIEIQKQVNIINTLNHVYRNWEYQITNISRNITRNFKYL